MNQRHFGRKSEANLSEIDGQISLFDSFNEADLDGLPSRIFEHKLSKEELAHKFPNGYKELPKKIYKRLYIIQETFIVDEHHVHVYASKSNNGIILKAPRPKDLFRHSIATPALVLSTLQNYYSR